MAKRKFTVIGLAGGTLLALAIYLLFQLALAVVVLRGFLPENALPGAQLVSAAAASFTGGLLASGTVGERGTLPGAVASTVIFLAVLLAVGILSPGGLAWTGQGKAVLACALGGGILAGICGAGRHRRKRHGKRGGGERIGRGR